MLPPEHKTAELLELERLMRLSGEGLLTFPHLRDEDHQLIGAYIQIYNFIELNLRRCVEIFVTVGMLPGVNSRKVHSSKLVSSVKAAIAAMSADDEDIEEALARFDEIELRRPFRNVFAHWAGRRFPNHDAVVFVTKDERDSERVHGQAQGKDRVSTAVIKLSDLRGLMLHMADHEQWIAVKTSEWHNRFMPNQAEEEC